MDTWLTVASLCLATFTTYQVLAEKKLFEIYSPRIPREAVTICHPGHSCMVYGKREELVSVGFFEEEEEERRILRVCDINLTRMSHSGHLNFTIIICLDAVCFLWIPPV